MNMSIFHYATFYTRSLLHQETKTKKKHE